MKVCVMGLGYIGFPTACAVAIAGHEVIGVDVNAGVVEQVNTGRLHIVNETGLAELAEAARDGGRFRASTEPQAADVFIIAVPTPFHHVTRGLSTKVELERPETDYHADLSYVESAARQFAAYLQPGNLIVLESTVPPGTTERILVPVLTRMGVDVNSLHFAHAPERVLPGNIVKELIYNNRIIGGLTPAATKLAAEFYGSFVKGQVHQTDATTAELVKLMENTFRDVNIALANEFALVAERLGVDAWEAMQLANLHPRVNFLRPGPGVGGHCIAVDPYFVVEAAPDITPLIQAARRVNRRMPLHVLDLFAELTRGMNIQRVAVLGASYKANVGDDRESPALEVAQLLAETGLEIRVHDPFVERYNTSLESLVSGADALLLLTDHAVYRDIEPSSTGVLMRQRLVLDTRGHLDLDKWQAAGFGVMRLGVSQEKQSQPHANV